MASTTPTTRTPNWLKVPKHSKGPIGHSLGSNVLANTLGGCFEEHQRAYSRMVTAYVVDFAATRTLLAAHTYLESARGGSDTDVIVSWNTEGPDFDGVNPALDGHIGLASCPLTWSHITVAIPASAPASPLTRLWK